MVSVWDELVGQAVRVLRGRKPRPPKPQSHEAGVEGPCPVRSTNAG